MTTEHFEHVDPHPFHLQLGSAEDVTQDVRLRTVIGNIAALHDAFAAFNPAERVKGMTIIRVRQ